MLGPGWALYGGGGSMPAYDIGFGLEAILADHPSRAAMGSRESCGCVGDGKKRENEIRLKFT